MIRHLLIAVLLLAGFAATAAEAHDRFVRVRVGRQRVVRERVFFVEDHCGASQFRVQQRFYGSPFRSYGYSSQFLFGY